MPLIPFDLISRILSMAVIKLRGFARKLNHKDGLMLMFCLPVLLVCLHERNPSFVFQLHGVGKTQKVLQ